MKKITVVFIALLVAFSVSFAQKPAVMISNEPGWHKIGEITASFKLQNESIVVWGADRFSQIKIRVTDAPINIQKLQVVYESGETEDIDVNSEIEAWGETRTIDLKNANKEIEKVAFIYQTLPNYRGEKAQVELYGYKTGPASDSYRSNKDRDLNDNGVNDRSDVNRAARETKEDVKEGADKVGDKISNMAGNAKAEVDDQIYVDKMGPNGENIYIDNHSRYYYINKEGKKVYMEKAQLRNKVKKD